MDNGALQATGILNIIVQTLNAEQAKQALNNINQRLQNVNRTASKMGPSFRRGIIGVFYMRQALKTVTNAVKEFGAGNDLLAEKLDTVSSSASDAILGFMVMQRALPGLIGTIAGVGVAVTRVVTTIVNWRKHMMEAAAGVISKYSTVNNTLKKIAESTSDIETLANYMKLVKNYGEEGAIALLKMGEVNFETLVENSETFQKNLLEILKDSEVGRRILKETATTQKIMMTDTFTGLEEQVEIIKYNVIPAWRKFKRELNLGEFGTVLANIQSLNKGLDDFYTKLYGYRAPTPKGVGTEEWEKEQEKLKDIEQYLEEKKNAEQKFYQELLKLRGQDFEAFKLDLKQKIEEYSKYITNKKLLEEYYNRSIQQYLDEQERERKEFINKVVSADVEAINKAVEEKKRKEQEYLEEKKRQQNEWENFYLESLNKETDIFVKNLAEQLKEFTIINIEKEELIGGNFYSTPDDMSNTLRWIGIMNGLVDCDLCATNGIHSGKDAIKFLLAGASAVQMVSSIYINSADIIEKSLHEIKDWMEKHNYESIDQFRGKLSKSSEMNTALYERVQFMKYFGSKKK